MSIKSRRFVVLSLLAVCASATPAHQSQSAPSAQPPGKIYLDVVVTAKSGAPASGLQEQDFTLIR